MIPMELKKLGNGNAAMEWKKFLSILRTRRTTMFLSGFAFTLFLCSVIVFFNNVNPLNQGQTWLSPVFSNSSGSRTIFTFFFPNSDSSKVDKSAQDPQGKHASVVDDMSTVPEEGLKNKENGKNSTQETPLGVSVPNGSGDVVSSTDSSNQAVNTKKDPQEPRGESVAVGNKERMPDDGLKTRENGTDSSVPMSPRDLVKKKDSSAEAGSTTHDPGEAHDQSVVDKIGEGINGTQQTLSNGSVPIKSGEPDLVNKTASSGYDKPLEVVSGNGTATPDLVPNVTESKGAGISNGSSEAVQEKKCDIFSGRWAPDDTKPLYPPGSCPYIDESFNCFLNRRPDKDYEKWRWQPNDCDIPRFNATDMLERLRGKRLAYVGDSLNRNMWESMVCMLRHAVANKSRVFEISGKKQFRTEGFYSFMYEDYNCSVDFIRAPFLVQEWEVDEGNGTKKETLRLDLMDSSTPKYKDADIIVFNTGHWWTHEKTSKGQDYYQEGDHVYPDLNVLEAYRKALNTWAKWVDSNINPNRTIVFFRGYSATHFSGGQWNSGGQCHQESEPIYNETYITKYNQKMLVFESVMQGMTTPVNYLNITRITDYRKDAHPSIYRKQYLSQEERIQQVRYQDCSHWCLPGVPDTWNELVYASLLLTGKGVWAT